MGLEQAFFANLAEGQGFEPWEAFASPVFKTSAFDRSATPPGRAILPFSVAAFNIMLTAGRFKNECGAVGIARRTKTLVGAEGAVGCYTAAVIGRVGLP